MKKFSDFVLKPNRNLKCSKSVAKFLFLSTLLIFPNECFGLDDLVYDLLAKREETFAEKLLKPVPIDLAKA